MVDYTDKECLKNLLRKNPKMTREVYHENKKMYKEVQAALKSKGAKNNSSVQRTDVPTLSNQEMLAERKKQLSLREEENARRAEELKRRDEEDKRWEKENARRAEEDRANYLFFSKIVLQLLPLIFQNLFCMKELFVALENSSMNHSMYCSDFLDITIATIFARMIKVKMPDYYYFLVDWSRVKFFIYRKRQCGCYGKNCHEYCEQDSSKVGGFYSDGQRSGISVFIVPMSSPLLDILKNLFREKGSYVYNDKNVKVKVGEETRINQGEFPKEKKNNNFQKKLDLFFIPLPATVNNRDPKELEVLMKVAHHVVQTDALLLLGKDLVAFFLSYL